MLFNSYAFLSVFLPAALAGFYLLRLYAPRWAAWWLSVASLVFYGYWNPVYLLLIVGSIVFNFLIARPIARTRSRLVLALGIAGNLAAIGFFKYSDFFLRIFVPEASIPAFVRELVLPLAISFFTFQQIAYLVDTYRRVVEPGRFETYVLFVTFFPQLIAGPIVRFQEIAPQIARIGRAVHAVPRVAVVGLAIFAIGLAKKVLLADSLAHFANATFDLAARDYAIGFVDAWLGTYAYTFQIYFDFSGYSDMAIGLGLMMGFRLPVNFFSPYKATTIVEFWRRWHISLSRFFRDYLYIPLGGNRHGKVHQYANLLLVMTLVGLWHGAGWTFVLWGVYHGVLLTFTHALEPFAGWVSRVDRALARPWRRIGASLLVPRPSAVLEWCVTFHLVALGWVLFRAESLDAAGRVFSGLTLQTSLMSTVALIDDRLYPVGGGLVLTALVVALALPNSIQIIERMHRVPDSQALRAREAEGPFSFRWRLSAPFAVALGIVSYLCVATIANVSTEFLYFNF